MHVSSSFLSLNAWRRLQAILLHVGRFSNVHLFILSGSVGDLCRSVHNDPYYCWAELNPEVLQCLAWHPCDLPSAGTHFGQWAWCDAHIFALFTSMYCMSTMSLFPTHGLVFCAQATPTCCFIIRSNFSFYDAWELRSPSSRSLWTYCCCLTCSSHAFHISFQRAK